MSKIPFSISDRSLTFYVNGRPYGVDRTNPAYVALKDLVQTDDPDVARLIALTNPVEAIQEVVNKAVEANYLPRGVVGVTRDAVTYNGEPIHGVLIDRIFDMLKQGFDIMPMIEFLKNLKQNPAQFAQDELYLWLETSDLPITEDGHFLAYKRVNPNFTSIHDGKTDNTPGTIVSIPRETVDKVRANTCSTGLHFCSKSYLPHFSGSSGSPVILLKINPADVVSIPSDYQNAKGRAWKYEVLHVVDFNDNTVWGAVYSDPKPEPEPESEQLLTFPSELAGALYAALNEIGVSTKPEDRYTRLDWAEDALREVLGASEYGARDYLDSFKELTVREAGLLVEFARSIKADEDVDIEEGVAVAIEAATTAVDTAEQARIEAINSYGILTLRSKASRAGMPGAWKGPKKAQLRAYLIENGVM